MMTPEQRYAYEKACKEFGGRENLRGIEVGYKYEGQALTKTEKIALRFLVVDKLPEDQLASEEAVFPERYEGMDTDVRKAVLDFGEARVTPGTPQMVRSNPIQPGISVSHGNQGAGTLGLLVTRDSDGQAALLGCAHVLSHAGAVKGDPIYQPSPMDGGETPFDIVGHLENWFVDSDGDAAIALLTRTRMLRNEQLSGVEIRGTREVNLGETLAKSGRGTGLTHARVEGEGRYKLQLPGSPLPTWIEGFRMVPGDDEISLPGDSGAVWYSAAGEGVGLHLDGEDGEGEPEFAIACHLPAVLKRLGVSPRVSKRDTVLPVDQPTRDLPDLSLKMEKILQSVQELLARSQPMGNGSRSQPASGNGAHNSIAKAPKTSGPIAPPTKREKTAGSKRAPAN